MKDLNVNELENVNGGSFKGWLTATATQCGTVALVTAEAPPIAVALGTVAAITATGAAICEAWD